MSGRYDKCPLLTLPVRGGRTIRYIEPRILPLGASLPAAGATVVLEQERNRLDLVANRALGDPLLAWRIADRNDAMDPLALCERPGAVLQLPASGL